DWSDQSRNMLVDSNDRGAIEDCMRGEHGRAEVMGHLSAGVVVQSHLVTVERQGPGIIRRAAGRARQLAVRAAVRALSASRQKNRHDLLTDLEVVDRKSVV